MQAIYKRASVFVGFVVLILVLVVNAWYIKRQLDSQVANHERLSHSKQVILELTETGLLLDDAETGQRGFLYTGKPAYLEPYALATMQIDRNLRTLAQLTADNPRQQKDLAQLTGFAHAKLDELRETISLYNTGNAQATRDLVLSDQGKNLMDDIRRTIADMEEEESNLEARRAAPIPGRLVDPDKYLPDHSSRGSGFGFIGLLHPARDGLARAPRRSDASR